MDSPPSAIPVAAMIGAFFYAGLLVRWCVEKPSNLPLTKQCVLGLLLGVLPVYIAVAAALESSLGTFAQDPTVQASIPLAGVVVLIIEQGYIWDDAQQHLRKQLIKAGQRVNDQTRSDGGTAPAPASLLYFEGRTWRGYLTTAILWRDLSPGLAAPVDVP